MAAQYRTKNIHSLMFLNIRLGRPRCSLIPSRKIREFFLHFRGITSRERCKLLLFVATYLSSEVFNEAYARSRSSGCRRAFCGSAYAPVRESASRQNDPQSRRHRPCVHSSQRRMVNAEAQRRSLQEEPLLPPLLP